MRQIESREASLTAGSDVDAIITPDFN